MILRPTKPSSAPTASTNPVFVPTDTPAPTMTSTQPVVVGSARVEQIIGLGFTNVLPAQSLTDGQSVSTTSTSAIKIVVGELGGRVGTIFLFPNSEIQINFGDMMSPDLRKGALFIQPGGPLAQVGLGVVLEGLSAKVSGSEMIVEIQGTDIWVYCFEGECRLDLGHEGQLTDPGFKQIYHSPTGEWEDQVKMTYDDEWDWNKRCNYCMVNIIATPTPNIQFRQPSSTPVNNRVDPPASTPVSKITDTSAPIPTETPKHFKTFTPGPTATTPPVPTATDPPVPTATNPPVPTATNPPASTATNPPVPTATNPPVPTATNPPVPTATDPPAGKPTKDH